MSGTSATPAYQVGIVGTGGIAKAHGRACKELECAELSAICDISEEALHRYAEAFGVTRLYPDLGQMLTSEELDIVIIANWGAFHAETGIQIAKSRHVKAILCEKPFTSTAAEAEQFVKAAKANGVLVAEAFKFRHHPMHLKAKELIDAGEIGEVKTIRSTFCTGGKGGGPETRRPEMNWRFNKAKGGGSIYDLGCYCIHHARFIFDADPVTVFAIQQPGIEVDDAMYILLTFPGERTAQISVGFNSSGAQYAEICGTKGMLRLDRIWNNEKRPVSIEKQTVDGSESIEFAPVFQFTNQLRHLCDCLTTGQPHRISPENSIHQMKVIDAVLESVETGNVVAI